jgi:exodeoxyribonuclease V alpha subunit
LIVTGGPGTGKTSTVLNLLRGLVRQGLEPERIALTAPTGRAARRLTESLRSGLDRIEQPASGDESLRALHGTTLHRLLRYMPDRNSFLYHRSNPLPFEVLIVDEVSMVDLALMAHLLDAVDPSRTRLICLGDRDQLPSVDAGAVLSDFLGMLAPGDVAARYSPEVLRAAGELLPETRESLKHPSFFQQPAARKSAVSGSLRQGWTDRIVELTWSFRSGDAILRAATAVNQGHAEAESLARVFPALVPVGGGQSVAWPDQGCYLVEEEAAPREGVVLDWIREHFDGEYLGLVAQAGGADPAELPELCARLFAHLNRSRILAIGRRGRAGVSGINAAAARWFHGRLGLRVARPDALFSGMPVLIVRNDHRRELYNGDVGVVLDVRSDGSASPGFRAYFERPGGRFTGYAMETLPTCEAAFALTVHKSQGSEYERVLLVLPDDPVHRLLSREVLYTGLTRARKLAVVYGSPAALTRAVREKLVRETGGLGGPRPPDRAGGGPGL